MCAFLADNANHHNFDGIDRFPVKILHCLTESGTPASFNGPKTYTPHYFQRNQLTQKIRISLKTMQTKFFSVFLFVYGLFEQFNACSCETMIFQEGRAMTSNNNKVYVDSSEAGISTQYIDTWNHMNGTHTHHIIPFLSFR